MKDLSMEIYEDIIKSFKILVVFSKLNESTEVSVDSLNYSLLTKSNFIGDWKMLQSVSSSIITSLSEFVCNHALSDGESIIELFESNCCNELLIEMHCEYLDTLTQKDLNALWDEEKEEYLIDEGFIYYLSCLGMKCLSVKIPFVTEINEITSKFLAYIPYLLQWKYDLSSCFFIKNHIEMNIKFNCAQVYIYYIPSGECDFLDNMKMNNLYDDFSNCITNEMIRRKVVC